MVEGLDIFRERFSSFSESFVLIGGAACDNWFTEHGIGFRATKDLDIVIIFEALNDDFVTAFRSFVDDGGYEIRQRSDASPILYRFAKPAQSEYPFMLELFCRGQEQFNIADGQTIIPVNMEDQPHSLSAILLDAHYYNLLQEQRTGADILFANATALIPLKAKAWLELSARRAAGEAVKSTDIKKHRADVFRLAATLPGEPGPELPENIRTDLQEFLGNFTTDSGEWPAIMAAIANTFGSNLEAQSLIEAISTYFRLTTP